MKLCRNCTRFDFLYRRCDRSVFGIRPDLVNGGVERFIVSLDTSPRRAADERNSKLPWRCGKGARYFQPRTPA